MGSGGGIYNLGGTVNVSQSTLSGNWAVQFGGGIYNSGGTVNVSHSTLSSNSAGISGGGIYNSLFGTVNVLDYSTIYGNSAPSGADLYNLGVFTTDDSSTIGVIGP